MKMHYLTLKRCILSVCFICPWPFPWYKYTLIFSVDEIAIPKGKMSHQKTLHSCNHQPEGQAAKRQQKKMLNEIFSCLSGIPYLSYQFWGYLSKSLTTGPGLQFCLALSTQVKRTALGNGIFQDSRNHEHSFLGAILRLKYSSLNCFCVSNWVVWQADRQIWVKDVLDKYARRSTCSRVTQRKKKWGKN